MPEKRSRPQVVNFRNRFTRKLSAKVKLINLKRELLTVLKESASFEW